MQSNENERLAALVCHLLTLLGVGGCVGQFIIPALFLGFTESPFVKAHARAALNFHISLLVYAVIAYIAIFLTVGIAAFVVLPVALVFVFIVLICPIIAMVKAARGNLYSYPFAISFFK